MNRGTSLELRGQRRRKQGAVGGVRGPELGLSLGPEEVHPWPGPQHGERVDALALAGPPGQEERLRHC